MRSPADERTALAGALASLLGAATLSPLISGFTWLVVAGVIVLIVMITGIIARHLLNHPVPVAAAQVVVLLATLEVLFARSRLLEGPGAITALTDLLSAGLEVTRTQPPPVEASQGVILLAAGGTGMVAVIVDLLACTLRQPALAGLPLLAIYCVPAALLPDGLPWYWFAGAALGFLLLLAADAGDRVDGWGRVLSSQPRRPADGLTTLGNGGRRAAAAAVVCAVLIPAVMPGLGNQILGASGEGDGEGDGNGSTITRINPIVDLRKDLVSPQDTEIIWYSADEKDPAPLRIVTADTFDGDRWAPNTAKVSLDARVQDGLPNAQGLTSDVSTQVRTTDIRIGRLRETYLPLPYPTQQVRVSGDWLYDPSTLNVIGRGTNTQGLTYSADYLDVEPTASQLENAPVGLNVAPVYTSLPERLPAVITDTAKQVAGNGTQYEQAIRLQTWLRESGGFTYSTDSPSSAQTEESSTSALVDFLRVKRGYCVHFASAMAVMARVLNIPSRVGIGFLPGDLQPNGQRVISVHDAHAWPELYFEGVGWVRFEPTPRAGEATPPQWAIPNQDDPSASQTPTAAPSAAVTSAPQATAPQATAPSDATSGGGPDIPWRLILVVLVIAAVLVGPWLLTRVVSSRRWARATSPPAQAEVAWDELRLGLQDLGAAWAWTWTPRGVQQRLRSEYDLGEAGTAALARLVAAIEAARYAPPAALVGAGGPARPLSVDLSAPDAALSSPADLRSDVRAVLDRVALTVPRGRRLRARYAPPSAGVALNEAVVWVATWGKAGPKDRSGAAPRDTISRD